VNFGDGPRHPTQLYEIAFLILLGLSIHLLERSRSSRFVAGARFRIYFLGYLLFRFCIEFIKPTFRPYLGLSAIQLASLVGATVCLMQLLFPHDSVDRAGDCKPMLQ